MDEATTRLVEQLKSNPAMLQQLMQSRDGQALMQMLTRNDQGRRPAESGPVRRSGQSLSDGAAGEPGDAKPRRGGFGGAHQQGNAKINRFAGKAGSPWPNLMKN